MNLLMNEALRWCQQYRVDRFQKLMSSAAEATLGEYGGANWAAQTAFLQSADGAIMLRSWLSITNLTYCRCLLGSKGKAKDPS
jgi:hypothetical protein